MENPKDHLDGLGSLSDLRKSIDTIDEKILELVNRRLRIAGRIGKLKKQCGDVVIDPKREEEIVRRLASKNHGPLKEDHLERIMRILIDASRAVQKENGSNCRDPRPEKSERPISCNLHPADARTALFGVIGNPVFHSLSPVMHNRAMQVTGYNGVYLAFQVKEIAAAIQGLRSLHAKGISVTLPFKIAVMEYLDELHESAESAGAVNTILNHGGRLIGYNTDGEASIRALLEKTPVKGKIVAIIGAGGAARAIGLELVRFGAQLILYNRSKTKGEALARNLGADFRLLSEFDGKDPDILIHATPVGMWPHEAEMPIPEKAIRPGSVVMDIVYNPVRTRLLQAAEKHEAIPIDGVSMFVHQGARQFELWTGQKAPVAEMRKVVLEHLCVAEKNT